jgi:hypothetical protein
VAHEFLLQGAGRLPLSEFHVVVALQSSASMIDNPQLSKAFFSSCKQCKFAMVTTLGASSSSQSFASPRIATCRLVVFVF